MDYNDLLFTPLGRALEHAFKNLESDFFGVSSTCNCNLLRTTSTEREEDFVITAEVPGLNEDQVDISYEDSILSITADWGEEKEDAEARTGKYKKSFGISGVDITSIDAKLSNGVLTLTVPKSENSKARKIKINKS